MRQVLHSEIAKEKCNAKALGAFNSSVEEIANNSFFYYIQNREKKGGEILESLDKQMKNGFDSNEKSFAAKILKRRISEDLKSFTERMKKFKEEKIKIKEKNKIKKSLKGLDSGLVNSIVSAIS